MNTSEQATSLSARRLGQHQWSLVGRPSDDSESRCFPLAPLPFQIGRRAGLSLTLPRQTVSGRHAELVVAGGCLTVRDLGSTNGTYVNGERIHSERVLADEDLIQFADVPFRLIHSAQLDNGSHTRRENLCDHALALVQFDRLFEERMLIPHYQPIIELHTGRCVAHEVLARSRLVGLEMPNVMFATAAQLGLAVELSQSIRVLSVDDCGKLSESPHLFLNTHPSELLETDRLLEDCAALRQQSTSLRITLEIHEAAITDVVAMTELRSRLEELDITLAFDDFGAGQARLAELAAVQPEYVKFDRRMIQPTTSSESSRKLVASLVSMVRDLGVLPLAEGVETQNEADTCVEMGFILAQGYFFGRPKPVSTAIRSDQAPSLSKLGNQDGPQT